ncbi:TlpA disulfide reductase family protein [Postechiella marina]|uniref:TlpA disulfide reductase family protein n=1 Tax=Postechiella marina TaxID=943941 RepID=A0ABP8C6K0_9FLAO
MKKIASILILSFLFVYSLTSCKDETKKTNGYTITGTVTGINNTYAKISEYTFFNQKKATVIDSVPVTNGTFKITGKVDFPDMVHLQIGKCSGAFLLENSNIDLTINVSNIDERNPRFEPLVKGSKSHDEVSSVTKKARAVYKEGRYPKLDAFNKKSKAVYASNDSIKIASLDKERKALMPLMNKRQDDYNNVIYSYVRQNPSSSLSPHVLGVNYTEGRMSRLLLKEFYNTFEGDARKTGFFKNFIEKIYKDNFENLGVGNTAPDFTLKTVNGDKLTLSKVEGKYKLVDFWASWCIPCRASFPHLKELSKQYKKQGFTIIGVGTADEEAKWRKAIEEDKTTWNHVYDVSENHKYGPVAKSYGVPHLPTTLLVDANNKIVLRNPTKEELDSKLKELFKN